ncbi:MAG: sporulation integral membrane protein YlbJ [Bacillota bacterium]
MSLPQITLSRLYLLLLAGAVVFATICLVLFPQEGYKAAGDGLKLFWEIVFPSLLPFFILSELMLGLGVVHFMGVFLEPMMRPLFNVPGVGAFAMSMGLAAGYPMDAVITGKFRRVGLCSRIEGERLLAFTNTADPLFIIGAVAVGMFRRPELGMLMAAAHYLSSFAVGLIFRFYGKRDPEGKARRDADVGRRENMLYRAFRELEQARKKDGRPVGQLMAEAVKESIGTLFMICGFIVLFSVINTVLLKMGLFKLIAPGLEGLLKIFGIHASLSSAILQGFFEIDIGTMAASRATAPFLQKAAAAGAIIAWSGLSVHGQVAGVLHGTDIRMVPYVAARLLQALFAGAFTFLLFGPMSALVRICAIPVLVSRAAAVCPFSLIQTGIMERVCFSLLQWLVIMGFFILTALGIYLKQKVRIIWVGRK